MLLLFLSEELCVQCGAAFLGFEDLSKSDCEKYLIDLQTEYRTVNDMIKNESGLSRLNKNMRNIIKYKHNSPIITYYKEQKRKGRLGAKDET